MSGGIVLLAAALAGLAAHLATIALFLARPVWPRRPAGTLGLPTVTLLRPCRGVDAFEAETLASSFAQDYPDVEIVFCVAAEDDPVVPLVRRLIAAHPRARARLLVGDSEITRNPKVNNVAKGWDGTASDWVCMTDSNLLLPPDYLRTVVASWGPGVGLVSSPAAGTRPDGFAGHLECAFLNGNQARLQFAADSLGAGYAQGKTLFWNRAMLDRAGGLPALGRFLAEDVAATRLVRGAGLRVRLVPRPFAQPVGRRRLREVWDRQLRWSRIRRDGFPALFALEILNGAVAPTLALAGAVLLLGFAPAALAAALATYLMAWYGAEGFLLRRAGWPAAAPDLLAMPVRDILIPAIWAATFRHRGIEWRGTAMAARARTGDAGEVGS